MAKKASAPLAAANFDSVANRGEATERFAYAAIVEEHDAGAKGLGKVNRMRQQFFVHHSIGADEQDRGPGRCARACSVVTVGAANCQASVRAARRDGGATVGGGAPCV